ncbi:MAG TPA: glycine--tRNA ligase subunit beta [Steroidobacteraceae bacterium]|nr:glycine--tRNA ligase subunit beta [Steroidobacteraceae bacterium]
MSTKNLLVELFVEELPPKALKTLGEVFADNVYQSLAESDLIQRSENLSLGFVQPWEWYASPRRLSVLVRDVLSVAPSKNVVHKVMPVSVALDGNGKPTSSLTKRIMSFDIGLSSIGWAVMEKDENGTKLVDTGVRPFGEDSTNVNPSISARLFKNLDGKTESLYLERQTEGRTLSAALQKAIKESLAKLPIPKVMSYQLADGWTTVNFVRPAHGLVALHGADVVPVSILGLQSSNVTHGHRFEAKNSSITINNADSYESQLAAEGAVIASFAARRASIVEQLRAIADKEELKTIEDDALLDEVTALVERPNVLMCKFEEEFLQVPPECLILTMKANQKYFPLLDKSGKLTNKFLIVSNICPADPSRVIEGNERVVRPRLADAKFFFEQDRKKPLDSHIDGLRKVVYHNKLGSTFDKVTRIKQLAAQIYPQLPANPATSLALVEQAALLCKCDLLTSMVGEFPELQGIMGRYYALADGKSAELADAMSEHYLPRGAGDDLPKTTTGMALALADKLDTIVGVFAIDQKPTGAKDPFGLRRAAIGVLRIIIENRLNIDLLKLINFAVSIQPVKAANDTVAEVYEYSMERLRGYYLEGNALDVTTEMFDAVLANRPASPLDFDQRLRALHSFLKLSDAQSLAAANKRISNILKKVDGAIGGEVEKKLLEEAAEKDLYKELQSAETDATPMFAARNYQDALTRLALLRPAVDKFFDGVMVMSDDVKVRNNRLALLARLRNVFLQVADLSRLPG